MTTGGAGNPHPARHRAEVGEGLRGRLRDGFSVLVHCKGGLGRAGTIAARLLIELSLSPREAVYAVRHARPGAIETSEQHEYVRWPGFMGQFGGFAKLGSGSRQAANLVSSSALVPIAPYASSGVRPFSPECGRRLL